MVQAAYTFEEYWIGWAIYLAGAFVFLVCWWFLTAGIKSADFRQILRVITGAFLLVPWFASPDLPYLAPAWIVVILEIFFEKGDTFLRAGVPLLVGVIIALLLSLVVRLKFWRSKSGSSRAA